MFFRNNKSSLQKGHFELALENLFTLNSAFYQVHCPKDSFEIHLTPVPIINSDTGYQEVSCFNRTQRKTNENNRMLKIEDIQITNKISN